MRQKSGCRWTKISYLHLVAFNVLTCFCFNVSSGYDGTPGNRCSDWGRQFSELLWRLFDNDFAGSTNIHQPLGSIYNNKQFTASVTNRLFKSFTSWCNGWCFLLCSWCNQLMFFIKSLYVMLRLKWNGLRFAVYRATWCVDNEKRFAARFVVRVSVFKAVNREWCLHCRLNRTGFAICGSVKNIYNKSGNARTETSLLTHHILCYLQVTVRLKSIVFQKHKNPFT